MRRAQWFFHVVWRAFRRRPGRKALALAALTVGATLLSAFLNLYFDLPRKVTEEFRTLGPNLVLAPQGNDSTLPETIRVQLSEHQQQWPNAPWLYAVARVNDDDVVVGGTELDRLPALNPGWRVLRESGSRAAGESLQAFRDRLQRSGDLQKGWLLAGEKAAAHYGWKIGAQVRVTYSTASMTLPLLGIVSTGGSEDSQLLLPLASVQQLTGLSGRLSVVQMAIPGPAAEVESARQQLVSQFPEIDVRPLRPVLESEARVVLKVQGLLFGLTAVVLSIVLLSVATTVSGLVLDREYDIGVMKALGANDRSISLLFSAEMAFLAIAAAAGGYLVGLALAQLAAHRIFLSALAWRWATLPLVMALTVIVAFVATMIPVQRIRRLDAAILLRGN